jgi:flagellar biosynthesis protein
MKYSRYERVLGIEYAETGENAPSISVKGQGSSAEEIVRIATRYGIPVIEQPQLTEALFRLPLDTSIPVKWFETVAIIFREVQEIFRRSPP